MTTCSAIQMATKSSPTQSVATLAAPETRRPHRSATRVGVLTRSAVAQPVSARPWSELGFFDIGRAAPTPLPRQPTRPVAERVLSPGDGTEEPVRLVVRSSREEERVGWSVVGRAVAELQCPEPVDDQRLTVRCAQLPAVLEVPVRQLRIRIDVAVAEVANQQIAAEAAEVGGRQRHAPGCVELAVLGHPAHQCPRRVIDVDESKALTVNLVCRCAVLLGVSDEQA